MKDELKFYGLLLAVNVLNVLLLAALFLYLFPKVGYFG
jgi:hypothetical protein